MSMKDMNIAKLTSQDTPLFNGIVQDLFPGVEAPVIDYGKVSNMYVSYTYVQHNENKCPTFTSFHNRATHKMDSSKYCSIFLHFVLC